MLIVARRGTSVREEVLIMTRRHYHQKARGETATSPRRDAYAPSQARRQARAALTRARRTKKTDLPAGEIPGQLSIDDVLAEIAAEQAAEQVAEGGEQS